MNLLNIRGTKCVVKIVIMGAFFLQLNNIVLAQAPTPDKAINFISIKPADTSFKCDPKSHPMAIINSSPTRTITATLELTYKDMTNHRISQKEIVFDNMLPGENRYVGCAGCTTTKNLEKCIDYKVLNAMYEAPDSVRVRNFLRE